MRRDATPLQPPLALRRNRRRDHRSLHAPDEWCLPGQVPRPLSVYCSAKRDFPQAASIRFASSASAWT
jgi:hypothetical protein